MTDNFIAIFQEEFIVWPLRLHGLAGDLPSSKNDKCRIPTPKEYG